MDVAVILAGAVVGLLVGLVVARVVAVSVTTAATAAVRRQAGADREAVVRAAVDTVVAVAGERLGAQADAGARELQARHDSFEQRVGELHELVAGLRRERAEQHGAVEVRLAEVAATSARLADTTQGLRQALASPQARGQWGERMAEDVLRAAGLVEGISYRKQAMTSAGTVPDFTFPLPGGRALHMDVKFPIDNYLRHLEATSDGEREQHRVAFVRDVRARVRELAGRSYIDPDDTVDEVLLFIPNEAVYAFVHTHDRGLVDVALAQKVVLCSPCTLFSVLAIIRQAVEQSQLQRRSDDILRCLAGVEQQWGRFAEALDRVGRQLDTARRGWDDLAGPRRRQLEREFERVDDLRRRRDPLLPPDPSAPAGPSTSTDPADSVGPAAPPDPARPSTSGGPSTSADPATGLGHAGESAEAAERGLAGEPADAGGGSPGSSERAGEVGGGERPGVTGDGMAPGDGAGAVAGAGPGRPAVWPATTRA